MSMTNSRQSKEIEIIRGLLVKSDAQIRWTADENMIMNGLTKDHTVKLIFPLSQMRSVHP